MSVAIFSWNWSNLYISNRVRWRIFLVGNIMLLMSFWTGKKLKKISKTRKLFRNLLHYYVWLLCKAEVINWFDGKSIKSCQFNALPLVKISSNWNYNIFFVTLKSISRKRQLCISNSSLVALHWYMNWFISRNFFNCGWIFVSFPHCEP